MCPTVLSKIARTIKLPRDCAFVALSTAILKVLTTNDSKNFVGFTVLGQYLQPFSLIF